ncbi:PH domain-containing protein [Actinopolymorpha cephalotaxi]|uniref:PH domain-containing protein n=1 Tax=Actinopolymorpha cephalotaxi TaxID=504797 RepID=A0ABX2S4Q1_9ACTN|nr:PH domain-containing protein [Actinopolymorpha cephalotaxi]NYH84579.1 hypothetical protein [Actinopolymorpha cephalotaxi]
MTKDGAARTWRVRGWIRIAGVVAIVLLGIQQASVIHFVRAGQMDPREMGDGFVFIGMVALVVWFLAFRPRVRIDANRIVEIRNPLRTTRFSAADVVECRPTDLGLQFRLRDGSTPWSIVFQATASFGEPRWFDVAEAVTGNRPTLPDGGEDNG